MNLPGTVATDMRLIFGDRAINLDGYFILMPSNLLVELLIYIASEEILSTFERAFLLEYYGNKKETDILVELMKRSTTRTLLSRR